MVTVVAISDEIKTLGQVEAKLGIGLTEDSDFFGEWLQAMPELAEDEQVRDRTALPSGSH
jgi:hypothetical protein